MPNGQITQKLKPTNGHALPSTPILRCSKCGAETEAACMCAVPYIPASKAAVKAITENPGLSNRAIAAKSGIPLETIRRARNVTDPNGSVEKRTGRDGKTRRMPKVKKGRRTPVDVTPGKIERLGCDFDFENDKDYSGEPDSVFRARAADWQLDEALRLAEEFAWLRPGTEAHEIKASDLKRVQKVIKAWTNTLRKLKGKKS
jgi:hypothetical protein